MITGDVLLVPATSPPVGELVMVVNHGDTKYGVPVHPRRAGGTFVSVLDVIETAKDEVREAVRGVFPNGERSFRRNLDGTWDWRGVRAVEDQNGICVLWLDV
jgi:hypothetical protein